MDDSPATGGKEQDMNDDVEYQPTGTTRYGNYYWCVKAPKSVCAKGEINLADKAEVTAAGTWSCVRTARKVPRSISPSPGGSGTSFMPPALWTARR